MRQGPLMYVWSWVESGVARGNTSSWLTHGQYHQGSTLSPLSSRLKFQCPLNMVPLDHRIYRFTLPYRPFPKPQQPSAERDTVPVGEEE